MWNNSHRTPPGSWQKNSYTTKDARQISMKPGRTEKKKKKKRDQDETGAPWEGSVRERRSTQVDPRPGEHLCLKGNLLGQIKGLEKPRLFSRSMCIQGRERLVPCRTSQSKGAKPQPHLLHTVAWHKIRTENQSSCAESDRGARCMILAKLWRPYSAHTWGQLIEWGRHCQHVHWWHKSTRSS